MNPFHATLDPQEPLTCGSYFHARKVTGCGCSGTKTPDFTLRSPLRRGFRKEPPQAGAAVERQEESQ